MGNRVIALVPAFNESAFIGDTVEALRALDPIELVLVVDDGSRDDTSGRAIAAGGRCLVLKRNGGKGFALNAGVTAIRHWLLIEGTSPPLALLLADADLGASAGHLHLLIEPVLRGACDIAIADLPSQQGAEGFGFALFLARRALMRHAGMRMNEPLSGQRALSWPALGAVFPFGPGFAVEIAMTIDALRTGMRVVEVPVPLRHRATGRDPSGIRHRSIQAAAIAAEFLRRELRPLRGAPRLDAFF
jgi:glycosyltransferase involved in cell wall biosynthesis